MTFADTKETPGKSINPISPEKTELPDGRILLYGRTQRLSAGPLSIRFGHRFSEPKRVVVLANPNFSSQAGFIETVTKIEADHFIVTSNNAHFSDSFVSWMAIGK